MPRWLLLLLATGCNAVFGLGETGLVNDNPRILLFDSSGIDEDLIDFPVPVFLDPTVLDYARVANPETELRFVDPETGVDLPFDVEAWTPDGDSVIWVRVPQIDRDSTSDSIHMFFGPEARGSSNRAGVWADYQLVVHGEPERYQSASVDLQPEAVGMTSVPGVVGPAFQLGASGDHSVRYTNSAALFDRWSKFTVELWLYADYANGMLGGEPRIIGQYPPIHSGRLINPGGIAEYVLMQIDVNFTTVSPEYANTFVPLRKWVHLTWTYDGTVLWIYRNGALAEIYPVASTTARPLEDLLLGDTADGLAGMIDEVRISNLHRSDAWLEAQYRSMRGNFVRFQRPGGL